MTKLKKLYNFPVFFCSFQLPHVKRRIKIAEITSRFKMPYSNKQLISDLFATNKFSL